MDLWRHTTHVLGWSRPGTTPRSVNAHVLANARAPLIRLGDNTWRLSYTPGPDVDSKKFSGQWYSSPWGETLLNQWKWRCIISHSWPGFGRNLWCYFHDHFSWFKGGLGVFFTTRKQLPQLKETNLKSNQAAKFETNERGQGKIHGNKLSVKIAAEKLSIDLPKLLRSAKSQVCIIHFRDFWPNLILVRFGTKVSHVWGLPPTGGPHNKAVQIHNCWKPNPWAFCFFVRVCKHERIIPIAIRPSARP